MGVDRRRDIADIATSLLDGAAPDVVEAGPLHEREEAVVSRAAGGTGM